MPIAAVKIWLSMLSVPSKACPFFCSFELFFASVLQRLVSTGFRIMPVESPHRNEAKSALPHQL